MSNLFKLAVILISAMLMAACGSTTTIKSDYDRSVDFSQFKTYGYFSPMGIENPNYSSLLGQMFRDAIDAQMQSRGYVLSGNPDLLINVSARTAGQDAGQDVFGTTHVWWLLRLPRWHV